MDIRELSTYQAGVLQSSAHRALSVYVTDLLKPHNLTMMQWFVLGLVHDAGTKGARMSELSDRLDTTMAFVTNHINRLEIMGLVTRKVDSRDTRARIVTISSTGRAMVKKIEVHLRQEMKKGVYSLITPEEMQTYINVLYKLSLISKSSTGSID